MKCRQAMIVISLPYLFFESFTLLYSVFTQIVVTMFLEKSESISNSFN